MNRDEIVRLHIVGRPIDDKDEPIDREGHQ
jgi:hypothetical protein